MKIYFLILPIILGNLVLTQSAISADRTPGSSATRWGITTKMPVEEAETKDEDIEKKTGLKNSLDSGNDLGDAVTEENDDTDTKDITKDNKQSNTITPEKSKSNIKKNSWENSRKQKEEKTELKWKNEAQKTQCKAYLALLRESFLKARYYSIQGVPCDTAENARSFMTLIDECKRDCPDRFLKKNGYTSRIIRNLSWLEKLGSERCPDMNSNLPRSHTD